MKLNQLLWLLFLIAFIPTQAQNEYNKLDAKGLKDGLWRGFYEESKRLRYEGNFNHGKEVGLFKFFDDTKKGDVIATREFNLLDGSAYTIFYDQDKNKVSEGKVIDKVFEGEWKYYHHAATTLMIIENYSKGKLEGIRTVYYPNGAIAEQTTYKNNLKEGAYKKYAEDGIVLEESFYKNNQYDGQAIFRDSKGTIVARGLFVNGIKSGEWEILDPKKLLPKAAENLSPKFKNPKQIKPLSK